MREREFQIQVSGIYIVVKRLTTGGGATSSADDKHVNADEVYGAKYIASLVLFIHP